MRWRRRALRSRLAGAAPVRRCRGRLCSGARRGGRSCRSRLGSAAADFRAGRPRLAGRGHEIDLPGGGLQGDDSARGGHLVPAAGPVVGRPKPGPEGPAVAGVCEPDPAHVASGGARGSLDQGQGSAGSGQPNPVAAAIEGSQNGGARRPRASPGRDAVVIGPGEHRRTSHAHPQQAAAFFSWLPHPAEAVAGYRRIPTTA